jgi:hypothetical protein
MLEDTVVIDVDSHWEPPRHPGVLGGNPTGRVRNLVTTLAEDVLRNLPRDEWPPLEPVAVRQAHQPGPPGAAGVVDELDAQADRFFGLRRRLRQAPEAHGPRGGAVGGEPGMIVFSSDYPHIEGSATPIDEYRPELGELDAAVRTACLGSNIAHVLDRMGDPIPVTTMAAA